MRMDNTLATNKHMGILIKPYLEKYALMRE